ncbi:MAG: autotransporter domain-containing protein [Planctomycetota bacterium]
MPKMKPFALLAALFLFTALSAPGTAGAAGFNQFNIFGDSTLDTGYFAFTTSGTSSFDIPMQTALHNGLTGGFAGDGVMNTTMLADKFGLSATPADAPGGGTNYANGGATTVVNHESMVPDNVCTLSQIEIYLAKVHGVANPNALYLIKSGDNDVTFVLSQGTLWQSEHPTYLSDGAQDLAVKVASLQAAGARTIVVRNSYDSALFAGPGGFITSSSATAAYAVSYSTGVAEWTDLVAQGVRFIPADNDSLFKYVVQHPGRFGFTSDSVQAINAPFADPHVTACFDILSPAQQRDYLFIDGVHLTTAGQTIEADYTYSLLIAPSEISLLAESVVQGGWARAATIQSQMDASEQHRGPCGFNAWTSAGVYSLQVNHATGFTGDSGTPFGGTVGIDYQLSSGLIVGAAFTTDSQATGFSTGGHFNQVEEAPSLYAAYRSGAVWGNAVATYDSFQDRIERSVPLGVFTDQNNASTTGQSFALALRGGYDLNFGKITTGPVMGLVMQEVRVDGFTENGTTGVTALSFDGQTRESFVSQLGWRVSADLGRLRPFVEASWNHECAGKDRTVTAWLTSSTVAPSYTMDAVPMVSDWATSSLGAYYTLNPRVILRGAASAMYINPQMITCGGEFGINVSF